ncbi:restriction endonuclease subunit S [Frondihabitans sp. 4ASC-45]|uniref:restriction endonuclease subunit S n=1 Tax=Frondihabitans sp. 4ASC-45 TaxID=3111636 RepID=UPI003C23622B
MSWASWPEMPLKAVASVNDEVLPENQDETTQISYLEISDVDHVSGARWGEPITFGSAPSRARRIVRPGDVLVSTVRTYLRAVTSVQDPPPNAIASTGFAVLRPRCVDSRFLGYAILAPAVLDEIVARSVGISYPAINAADLMSIKIQVPATPDQEAIADFLDEETGEIDAFIRDQEDLIGLLQERRAATVSHAVTKGLNPDAPFTESGSNWLGLIPSHWTVATLRRILGVIEQGISPQAEAGPAKEGETGVLKSGCVNGGVFREDEQKKLPDGFSYPASLVVRPGDLLMNRASGSIRLLGSAALVDHVSSKLILSDKTFRLHPLPSMASTQYLNALLNSTPTRRQIESSVSGAEGLANNLPMASIRQLVVAMPPPEEQSRIVNYLQDALHEVDLTIADARRAVALSRERRVALISGAVTGKIHVRELVEV